MNLIILTHALLLARLAIGAPGGVRKNSESRWETTVSSSNGSGVKRSAIVVTSRDTASRYSSNWIILRKGSHRIPQESPHDPDNVQIRMQLRDRSQLHELQELENQGKLTIKSVEIDGNTSFIRKLQDTSYDWSDYSCYDTVNETYARMERISMLYPDFVNLTSIGESWKMSQGEGGYSLQAMVLTSPVTKDTEKENMMVIGGHHSRELPPPTLILHWAEHMLENYGKDADITWILDRTNLHLIPLANPDGRAIAQEHMDWYYRKNARSSG